MNAASPAPRGVYLITPDEADTARLLARTAPLLAAGASWLQYRNKTASDALRLDQATALQALCAGHGVPLIINDDPALAQAVGASYVAFGAFFPTTTKITSSRAHTDLLRQTAALGVPRVAIGGLTPDNVGPIIDAGADLVAVVSGIYAAPDPVATQRAFLAQFA